MKYTFALDNDDYQKKVAASFSKEGQSVHNRLVEMLNPQSKDSVLDLGCGWGTSFPSLLQRVENSGFVIGFDINQHFLAIAERRFHNEFSTNQLALVLGKQGEVLPFSDNFFDKILCHNVLENVLDKAEFLNECYRVLKSGGTLLLSHTDFDTAVYNSSYKDLTRTLVHNFADFIAPEWQETSDGQIGRKLRGLVAHSLFKKFSVRTIVPDEEIYAENTYGFQYSNLIAESAKANNIPDKDIRSWLEYLKALNQGDRYYFAILTMVVLASK